MKKLSDAVRRLLGQLEANNVRHSFDANVLTIKFVDIIDYSQRPLRIKINGKEYHIPQKVVLNAERIMTRMF